MLLVFRLEFNRYSGRGHFNRCLILAKSLKKKYGIIFLINKCDSFFKTELKKNNLKFIEKKFSLKGEIKFLKKINKIDKIKAIIKDTYKLDYNWEKNINKLFKLVVIDDRLSSKHHSNLYINYNYERNYCLKNINLRNTKIRLLGQKYFIYRNEYLNKKKKSKPNFFIYLGSVDSNNYSFKIFDYLKKNTKRKIYFLLPQFNKNSNIYFKKHSKQKNIIMKKETKDFSDQLMKNDFVFHSGGTSVFESLMLGKKPIVISQNLKQKKLCEYLDNKKCIFHLKKIKDLKTFNFNKKNIFRIKKKKIILQGKKEIIKKIVNL